MAFLVAGSAAVGVDARLPWPGGFVKPGVRRGQSWALARGHRERGAFRRLCDVADRHELRVNLWTARQFAGADRWLLVLQVSDGSEGSSSAKVASAAALDIAANEVLGQLAMAGIE